MAKSKEYTEGYKAGVLYGTEETIKSLRRSVTKVIDIAFTTMEKSIYKLEESFNKVDHV